MLTFTLDKLNSILILEPHDSLTEKDFVAISDEIDPYIEENGSIKGLIIYVQSFEGWDSFSTLITHMKFVKNHHQNISRLAFVTDSKIAIFAEKIASHFVNPEIKNFDFDELESAKRWVSQSKITAHGLSIAVERFDANVFLKFKAVGTLTHDDYVMITPLIDSALDGVQNKNIKVLMDITEFNGWELRAAWDDFKIGLKHGFHFDKVAIYGHKNWLEFGIKIASWFMSSEIKEFDTLEEALEWIQ